MNNRPSVNFTGLEGCRLPMRIQSIEKIGDKMITKKGVHDWSQLDGKRNPKTSVRTSPFAKRLRLAPFCSYAAQNNMVNKKKMKIAAMRFQSELVNGRFATGSSAFFRFRSLSPTPTSCLRLRTKMIRPTVIPMPAAPNPQCQLVDGSKPIDATNALNPSCWARKPTTSGASTAPMLIPMYTIEK